MKKRILRLFSLILYLLCVCTILSWKIETEQMALIQYESRVTEESRTSTDVRIGAIFTDADGVNHLFQVVDGTGWEAGLRIEELSPEIWSVAVNPNGQPYATILGGANYRIVTSAARQPRDGEKAQVVEDFETVEDTYLALYPDGVTEPLKLPDQLTLARQGESALLLTCQEGQLPFLPSSLKAASITTGEAQQIYSLTEATQLLQALPAAAALPGLVLLGLVLWALSCCFSLRMHETRGLVYLNVVLIAASLGALYWVAASFDLPASMLPTAGVLQWRDYAAAYTQIFEALQSLGMGDHPLFSLLPAMLEQAAVVLRVSLGLLVAIPLLEVAGLLLWTRRARRREAQLS